MVSCEDQEQSCTLQLMTASTQGRLCGHSRGAEARQALTDGWPGRAAQIDRLLTVIGDGRVAAPPVLVHGGPSTGKTSVVRDVLRNCGLHCAYLDCNEHRAAKGLLLGIVAQLKGRKRRQWDSGASDSRSDQISDVLWQLPGLAPPHLPAHYVVIDHAHRLATTAVLPVLLRLREITGANIGVVLLSHLAGASDFLQHGALMCPRTINIAFPDYTDAQLVQILALAAPTDMPGAEQESVLAAYHRFLVSAVMPLCVRQTRRLEDLQVVAQKLWPVYVRPVREGSARLEEHGKLHAALAPMLRSQGARLAAAGTAGLSLPLTSPSLAASRPQGQQLDLQLPYCAKWLLLAAFLASRNRPTADRRLFDRSHKGHKRQDVHSHDRQVEAAKEAALHGPHAFPLERLLSIFWQLMRAQANMQLSPMSEQAADIFSQIASLTCLRLLVQVGGDIMEDARYRCNISEDLAHSIARNVGLQLNTYLLYT